MTPYLNATSISNHAQQDPMVRWIDAQPPEYVFKASHIGVGLPVLNGMATSQHDLELHGVTAFANWLPQRQGF